MYINVIEHYAKFAIDRTILTCLNLPLEPFVKDRRTDGLTIIIEKLPFLETYKPYSKGTLISISIEKIR